MAWKFISAASDLCLTLGYHRRQPKSGKNDDQSSQEQRLFWTVYAIEKGISLRLGRSSNIRDGEITLPFDPDSESRSIKLGRINGMIYDQLYSPVGLARLEDERSYTAEALARDLRQLIDETNADISVCFSPATSMKLSDNSTNRMPPTSRRMRCEQHICGATWSVSIRCLR
jgi:Fungal specific transcription factor domain